MSQPFADYDALYEQRLDTLKKAREERFKRLDGDFFKALETNDLSSQAKIAEEKNKLRSFPEEMSSVEFRSRNEIINYVPECFYNEEE